MTKIQLFHFCSLLFSPWEPPSRCSQLHPCCCHLWAFSFIWSKGGSRNFVFRCFPMYVHTSLVSSPDPTFLTSISLLMVFQLSCAHLSSSVQHSLYVNLAKYSCDLSALMPSFKSKLIVCKIALDCLDNITLFQMLSYFLMFQLDHKKASISSIICSAWYWSCLLWSNPVDGGTVFMQLHVQRIWLFRCTVLLGGIFLVWGHRVNVAQDATSNIDVIIVDCIRSLSECHTMAMVARTGKNTCKIKFPGDSLVWELYSCNLKSLCSCQITAAQCTHPGCALADKTGTRQLDSGWLGDLE